MLLKKLINHLPAEKKNIKINGLSTNSKKIYDKLKFRPNFTIKNAVQDLKKAFEENKLPDSLKDTKYFNIKKMQEINLN